MKAVTLQNYILKITQKIQSMKCLDLVQLEFYKSLTTLVAENRSIIPKWQGKKGF